jgi:hypothetical protein
MACFPTYLISIAGHRHRDQCRRHQYSGTQHLSPVPEHSGTGLTSLIPVPGFRHWHFKAFWHRTDMIPYNPAFWHWKSLYAAGGGKGYTLHVYIAGQSTSPKLFFVPINLSILNYTAFISLIVYS